MEPEQTKPTTPPSAAPATPAVTPAPQVVPPPVPPVPAAPAPMAPANPPKPASSKTESPVNLDNILLPKKASEPSPLSAQRVNAAAVLEEAGKPLEHETLKAPGPNEPIAANTDYAAQAPEEVPALHTYKSDVEDTVRTKKVSLADVAVASAAERAHMPPSPEETATEKRGKRFRTFEIAGGCFLLIVAVGLILFVMVRPSGISKAPTAQAPFIYVDETKSIDATGASRESLMEALSAAKSTTSLQVGLVEALSIESVASSTPVLMSAPDFFALLFPNAPASLARSLSPTFLVGLHSFAGNEPFFIFKTNSYEQTYAGMLAWENTMVGDLSPFITVPPPNTLSAGTTTPMIADTTVLQTPFVDRIVDNHDARVIEDGAGNIELLWTFIDRATLVVTTNANTLQEVINRLAEAPIAPPTVGY